MAQPSEYRAAREAEELVRNFGKTWRQGYPDTAKTLLRGLPDSLLEHLRDHLVTEAGVAAEMAAGVAEVLAARRHTPVLQSTDYTD